jgi:hypothetical protein
MEEKQKFASEKKIDIFLISLISCRQIVGSPKLCYPSMTEDIIFYEKSIEIDHQ